MSKDLITQTNKDIHNAIRDVFLEDPFDKVLRDSEAWMQDQINAMYEPGTLEAVYKKLPDGTEMIIVPELNYGDDEESS